MKIHSITTRKIDWANLEAVFSGDYKLELSAEARKKIVHCRSFLEKKIKASKQPIYGINTGFGSLCSVSVPEKELEQLQKNLVMSHACGFGEEVPAEVVKLMLFLKIQSLSYGKSGVQLSTVERLIDFYNLDILPVVYQQGSLGASGDLAPLAHLSLPLLGMGEVWYKGKKQQASVVLKKHKFEALHLKSKEGLALLNGTQFMSAYAVWAMLKSYRISGWADVVGSLSLDAFDGRMDPFHAQIQAIRPHSGQVHTAERIRALLKGSEIGKKTKVQVQDPYSFRCIPQVHGASKDAIAYAAHTFLVEVNSVTDNPTIFPDSDEVISGGNFHGQPLALALDFLAIALAELGNISERRTYQLISGSRGLPPFLAAQPGLHSGFMIPQYTAASIVSQSKQLCSPASVDSIVSSNGQEDHVSMGANAATKCYRVVQNTERILAIELITGAQALEFRRPDKSSPAIESLMKDFRKKVPFQKADTLMHTELEKSLDFLRKHSPSGL
ncbi:MAG: histidine ammonia-lyase [Bacteroidia bacterium]